MNWSTKNLSNERLEEEIANIYYTAARSHPMSVRLPEEGLLGALWAEFDYRYEEGLIEHEPWTGNEILD